VHLFTHSACLLHDTGAGHAERPARLESVTAALREAFPQLPWFEAPRATRGQLLRVHDDALLRLVLETPVDQPIALDPDTVLSKGSAEAALRAAGAGVAAVDAVMVSAAQADAIGPRAFCAVRPPGHHATASVAMGFCLFNNIAVAAAHACDAHGLARVAIIDFDVHHGNGTQAIFERDPRVLYLSSHQMPLYPDTGYSSERGVGNVVNAPLPPGAASEAFRATWSQTLLPVLTSFRPQLVLVSAGFDAHRLDPLAHLELEAEDYAWLTTELVAIAKRHSQGRILSMLEGGYDLTALRESSVAHVRALMG
jgi:acetoin utilization deacetylase AcuC-like enzyme